MMHQRATTLQRVLLAAILLACVLGRGAYVVHVAHSDPSSTSSGDTKSYVRPALALVDEGHFNHTVGQSEPEFIRTPGYPLFIAGSYKVFGVDLTALLLMQVVASACSLLLVYLLAARMWSAWIGLIGAALTLLEPSQNLATAKVLTECLATTLLLLAAWAAYRVFDREKPPALWAGLFGLALAAATMVRPITYYFPLCVMVLFAYRFVRRPTTRRAVVAATVAFLVPLVAIIGGWQLRNHREVDSWRLSGVEAKNLYAYRATAVLADVRGTHILATEHQLHVELPRLPNETQGSYYGRMYQRATHILEEHPVATVKVTFLGLVSEVAGVRLTLNGLALVGVETVALAGLYVTYALSIYGMVLVLRRRRHRLAHIVVMLTVAYVVLLSAGPEAYGGRGERFRAPIMPLVLIYAAIAGAELVRRFRPAGRLHAAR